MKKNFYFFLLLLVLLIPIANKVTAQCSVPAGTVGLTPATYAYNILDSGTTHTFTLTPDSASTGATLYINNAFIGPGTANGSGGYTWTPTLTNGSVINFYFLFMVGGQQQTKTYTYTVGSCGASQQGAPTVAITSPANNAAFTAPADITITADATASSNSTITKVEFYANNGTNNTLIGASTTAPYTFTWTNVPIGSYVLTAVATDDSSRTTTSAMVTVRVSGAASAGWCGSGTTNPTGEADYEWRAETVGTDSVMITFHPINRAAGSDFVIWNSNMGGFILDMQPNGDLSRIFNVGANTVFTFFFTYRLGAGGQETNTSATPHSYTKGTTCTNPLPVTLADYTVKQSGRSAVTIAWTTLSELNNKHFIVETSTDGRIFSLLGTVKAKGTGSEKQFYSFVDADYKGGIKYYRLSQVDKDGKITRFGVKQVNAEIMEKVELYPNPVTTGVFYIKNYQSTFEAAKVQVTSISGKVIFSRNITPSGNIFKVTMPVKPSPGVYAVSINNKFLRLMIQ